MKQQSQKSHVVFSAQSKDCLRSSSLAGSEIKTSPRYSQDESTRKLVRPSMSSRCSSLRSSLGSLQHSHRSATNEETKMKPSLRRINSRNFSISVSSFTGGIKIYEESEVKIQKKLGEGNFGEAYLVNIVRSNKSIEAVMKLPKDAHGSEAQTAKELKAMANLKHPNIVEFLGVIKTNGKICFLTAYYKNESLDKLHSKVDMATKRPFIRLARDICNGLSYLHSIGFIHRDLACRNLLMGENGKIVICDFGLSRQVGKDSYYHNKMENSFAWLWTSPESCLSQKFTKESDIWSLGVTFWEILTKGKRPYNEYVVDGLPLSWIIINLSKISTHKFYRLKSPPPGLFEDILRKCFAIKPEDRPSIDWILQELNTIENSNEEQKVSEQNCALYPI